MENHTLRLTGLGLPTVTLIDLLIGRTILLYIFTQLFPLTHVPTSTHPLHPLYLLIQWAPLIHTALLSIGLHPSSGMKNTSSHQAGPACHPQARTGLAPEHPPFSYFPSILQWIGPIHPISIPSLFDGPYYSVVR